VAKRRAGPSKPDIVTCSTYFSGADQAGVSHR
jgi:hypothetical protein